MRFDYHNEPFLPAISALTSPDSAGVEKSAEVAALAAAWHKVEKKVVLPYARSRGILPEHLRLIDLCETNERLHPRVLAFVEKLPRGKNQTPERYTKYKREIRSHLQRAIDAVIAHLRSSGAEQLTTTDPEPGITQPEPNEHPILAEIYKTLPRETVFISRKGRTQTETVTENGRLFYLSCVEALKTSEATTVQEFLLDTRQITKAIKQICSVEKVDSLNTILERSRKQLGISLPKRKPRLRSHDWPSPLREQFQKLAAAVSTPVSGEIRQAAAAAGVKVRNKIKQVTLNGVENNVGRLLSTYWSEGPLSIQDLVKTSKTRKVSPDGKDDFVYHNPFLTPFRERERARQSESKGAGFDSITFKATVDGLKTIAAYNGFFEYHKIISEAFKPHLDLDTQKERKAKKKALIGRHELDEWIEHNWTKYERILKGKTFVRDKSKRYISQADKDMRFGLFYLALVTMKVMGYRQQQIRDCRYGFNLRITNDSFTFTYTKEQTKCGKPLNFTANMRTSGITHGRLHQTLFLFYRYAYPYVQSNLAPRRSNDEADPSGQFFVLLDQWGRFRRFHLVKNQSFNRWFGYACRRLLQGPELSKQAVLLLHPHYLRGASMDTFMLDQGGTSESASKYYGDTVAVMEQKYRDRHAVQDASRDVMLVNANLKQLEELEVSEHRMNEEGAKGAKQSSSAEMSALLETNALLSKQLAAALEKIEQLTSRLEHLQ